MRDGGLGGSLIGAVLGYVTASGPDAIEFRDEDVEMKRKALEEFFAVRAGHG